MPQSRHSKAEPRGANLVDTADPAFAHIIQAASKLIAFGFDPSDPVMAARAIKVGRQDYENDPRTRAMRSEARSVGRRYGQVTTDEVVYYMRIGDRVKIGWSTNLGTRLAALNPEELMATEPGGRKLEAIRHAEFTHLRTHGEWFRMEGELVAHIERLRLAQDPVLTKPLVT